MLSRSQNLETIGFIASGIIHDFNNYLTVINGCADSLLLEETDESKKKTILGILSAAEKSANTAKQILKYSRSSSENKELINVREKIEDISEILKQLCGKNIHINIDIPHDLWHIKMNKTSFDKVVTNLVSNARDAVQQKGEITITGKNINISSNQRIKGDFVIVTVSDNGFGMDEETTNKIFLPYFTTKNEKETGLGLYNIHNIVTDSNGYVDVESVKGEGTTFKIYLPKAL